MSDFNQDVIAQFRESPHMDSFPATSQPPQPSPSGGCYPVRVTALPPPTITRRCVERQPHAQPVLRRSAWFSIAVALGHGPSASRRPPRGRPR